MARMEKNTLIQVFWGLALYSVLISLILMLRYRLIKIQIFGPIFKISPNSLTNRGRFVGPIIKIGPNFWILIIMHLSININLTNTMLDSKVFVSKWVFFHPGHFRKA